MRAQVGTGAAGVGGGVAGVAARVGGGEGAADQAAVQQAGAAPKPYFASVTTIRPSDSVSSATAAQREPGTSKAASWLSGPGLCGRSTLPKGPP